MIILYLESTRWPSPKFAHCIATFWSERYGRKCKINPMRNPRLFNILPDVRNTADTSVEAFKGRLDKYLHQVLDQSGCDGYVR